VSPKQVYRSIERAKKAVDKARIACIHADADACTYAPSDVWLKTKVLRDFAEAMPGLALVALNAAWKNKTP